MREAAACGGRPAKRGTEEGGFNADGQRVVTVKGKGSGSGESERFLRFGRGRPILAELSGNKITTRYVVLPGGQLLSRVGPVDSKPVFYHFDALGSTVTETDVSGRLLARFSYEPYGASSLHLGVYEAFTFLGADSVSEEDAELLEMGQRFYAPETGRFLSTEPLRESLIAAGSPYSYVAGNPTTESDPTGLQNLGPFAPATVPEGLGPIADVLNAPYKSGEEGGPSPLEKICEKAIEHAPAWLLSQAAKKTAKVFARKAVAKAVEIAVELVLLVK